MVRKHKVTPKPSNEAHEAFVPLLLRIAICASRALGVAPAHMRRVRGGWLLSVSPALVRLQRLIVGSAGILCTSSLVLDLLTEKNQQVHLGQTVVTGIMSAAKILLVMVTYSVGVLTSMRMERVIALLKNVHMIKTSLKWSSLPIQMRYNRVQHFIFIFYIIWHITAYLGEMLLFFTNGFDNVAFFYIALVYQGMVINFLPMMWSMAVLEISCTLCLVNDRLKSLLSSTVTPRTFGSLRHLNHSYDTICDMVRQMNVDNGPFMLLNFLLLFLYLLTTPYNFIIESETKNLLRILRQVSWTSVHVCHLMMLVEPCHRLQEQNSRTIDLLSKLVCQAGSHHRDLTPFRPFLLQVQMSNFTLALSDVLTIGRPLVASVVGGITTYLILIFQFQNVSEII